MIREALAALIDGQPVSPADARAVMEELMTGQATPAQAAGFLTALRIHGESPDLVATLAGVMREKSEHVDAGSGLLDTCGTGGDGMGTFNVSTAAAFIAAAAGARVAKHGNRAASSTCGSADVLEALGACIDLPPAAVAASIERCGMGFMFAQRYHPAMKHVAPVRRELGFRTVFNILGPLTNPAGARRQVIGAPSAALASLMAHSIALLGADHVLVVHSDDGLDEISLAAPTRVYEVRGGLVQEYTVQGVELGLPVSPVAALRGGSAEENAAAMRAIFSGVEGPLADFAILNAAAALYAGSIASDLKEGVGTAREMVASGKAAEKLEQFVEVTSELGRDS
jgi:anthranilate phosphoribosyltransferase